MTSTYTDIFRVRRGWLGRSVLQELRNYPVYIGNSVDSTQREFIWEDVLYNHAPRALVSQFCEDVLRKFTDGRK